LATGIALADDGALFRKNVSNTPDLETEFAGIAVGKFYVPAQGADGGLLVDGIDYFDYTGTVVVENRDEAKPLVAAYTDGVVTAIEDVGFIGHGKRDFYGAVSFDDGATWKKTNLSNSGTKRIKVATTGTPFFYYGDVIRGYHSMAGNKVMAIWASRYCDQGNPAYLLAGSGLVDPLTNLPYQDLFGVRGQQGYVDYSDPDPKEYYPTVGKVPYACVWTARGTIETVTNTTTGVTSSRVLWRQAERLTSGVRDAHRIEVSCSLNAGCAVSWQEDPAGLRPGDGEGPGEGWSGAVAHKGTDVWYSFMDWAKFDMTDVNGDGTADTLDEQLAATGALKPLVPMAIPVRLTDNEKCTVRSEELKPYCYGDIDGDAVVGDLCTDEFVQYTNRQGAIVKACVTKDGRVLNGQTAATRPRISLQSYRKTDESYSAWTVLLYEENKALGELDLDDDGFIDENPDVAAEIGKNVRYVSFEFNRPEVVRQNLQLNQPSLSYDANGSLVFTDLLDIVGCDAQNTTDTAEGLLVCDTLYDTEIARRGSLMVQPWGKVVGSGSRLAAMPLFKQGIINQGGPADIMARRFVAPTGFQPGVDNPYDERNMVCGQWEFMDGSNPNYLDGLCVSPAINLSATVPVTCDTDCGGYPTTLDPDFVDDDTGGSIEVPKVLTWSQTVLQLDDQSWENPMDVAKGHRGFLDKDFVMVLYAWSPNWKTNAIGKDQYNLYVRRSFDGGETWTTTPASLGGNGTTTCEIFRNATGGLLNPPVCNPYGAGEFEPARNVSVLTSLGTTVLDPRYAPAGSFDPDGDGVLDFVQEYYDDYRDPSRFAIVYETGDNATVALGGEATPLDLFYAQAVNFGDYYTGLPHVWKPEDVAVAPSFTGDMTLYVMPQFDALESNSLYLSGEAALELTPLGTYMHSVWNQWQETLDGHVYNSDAWFRRVAFYEGIENTVATGGGGSTGGGSKKPPKTK
jgi:hypothetical protein